MPTPTKGPRLGGGPAHERQILANLAAALFEHGRITTTETKAKRLRPYAERLITFARRGDMAARRRVLKLITQKDVVHTLFAEIGPRMVDRPGGYTRIIKVGNRKGDNAPMAIIELIDEPVVLNPSARAKASNSSTSSAAGTGDGPGEAATSDQTANAAEESQAEGDATTEATVDAVETAPAAEVSADSDATPEADAGSEGGDGPGEAATSDQTANAEEVSQAEGDDTAGDSK